MKFWNSFFTTFTGLILTVDCDQNSMAEKEVITSWILVGNHSVKNNKWFLGYTVTYSKTNRYLNLIKPSK